MPLPERKRTRLPHYDYNSAGAYFVTLCTKDRKQILSRIVGTGVPDGPQNQLTEYGLIAEKYIREMSSFYENISVDMFVIMPNHIHLLVQIKQSLPSSGPSRTPVPTVQNSLLSRFISTFKRFCNKEYGVNIWQYRSYEHVIRNREDYARIAQYIRENPQRWQSDCFYLLQR